MNKTSVCAAFREYLRAKLVQQEESLKNLTEVVRDAPGSNVTRSDTSRFQFGNQQLGQQKLVAATRHALASMDDTERSFETVGKGALVGLENEEGDISWYLILEGGGGDSIMVPDEAGETTKVISISLEAPLAQVLLKKEADDEVDFRGRTYFVDSVQ